MGDTRAPMTAVICRAAPQADEAGALCGKFRVSALPTFLVLKDGKVQGSVTGADFAGIAKLCEDAGTKLDLGTILEEAGSGGGCTVA